MYWTSELACVLGNAPWEGGISKYELIDYAERHGASQFLLDDLMALEDDGELYDGIKDLVDDVPTSVDFGWFDE